MSKKRRSLLWEIKGDGIYPGYLFGTMHVKDSIAYTYFEAVKPHIMACDAYVAEMDLDEAEELGQPTDFLLPDGQTLLDFMRPKTFMRLQKSLHKHFGIHLPSFIHFYPLFITNVISEALLSSDHRLALDQEMWIFAETAEKELTGVESFQDQMKTLQRLPIEVQIKQLISIGRNPGRMRKATERMLKLYREMDIHALHRVSTRGMGRLRHPLIYYRNRKMTESIGRLLSEKSCFIAVGAGHLSGEKGLLRLLKKTGLILRPVVIQQ